MSSIEEYLRKKQLFVLDRYRVVSLCVGSAFGICLFLSVLVPSYFKYSTSGAFIFFANDGWCNWPKQGIGTHCFGDFWHPMKFANHDNPWGMPHSPPPYPPLALQVFKPFILLNHMFPDSRIPLLAYLTLVFFCLTFPAIYLFAKRQITGILAFFMGSLLLVASPSMVAFDRGNNIALTFPFLFFFFYKLYLGEKKAAIIFGVLAAVIKPQFILLSLLLLNKKEYRLAIRFWLIFSITSLLSFTLYLRDFPSNLTSFKTVFLSFQEFFQAGMLNPPNLSLPSTWATTWRIISYLHPDLTGKDPRGDWHYYPNWITVLFLALIVIIFWRTDSTHLRFAKMIVVSLLPILLPNVGGAYYLLSPLALFPIVWLSLRDSGVNLSGPLFLVQSKVSLSLLTSSIIFLFIPWSLPWFLIPALSNQFWAGISLHWFIGQIVLQVYFAHLFFRVYRSRNLTESDLKMNFLKS